ncbi:phospholipase ABHD3-like, partial [Saccoglossus kowalevskii]
RLVISACNCILIGKDARFKLFLNKHCPVLNETYWPTFWCIEGTMMSLMRVFLHATIFRVAGVNYISEMLTASDGGEICLQWADTGYKQRDSKDMNPKPIILLLYGVTGNSDDGYILELVNIASNLGYRSVVMNYRGKGGAIFKTAKGHCPPYTGDLEFVMEHLKTNHPHSVMVCVAVSMGATVLFNYLAKTGHDCWFKAALVVSTAWDMISVNNVLENTVSRFIFNKHILGKLKDMVDKNSHLLQRDYDVEYILKSATIREFEERVLVQMFGYRNVEEYYNDCCIHQKISSVKIPVLCLNADNDPISPKCAFPIKEASQYSNIVLAITSHGGHVAFCERLIPSRANYMNRVFKEYVDAIFKFGEKELFTTMPNNDASNTFHVNHD